MLRRYRVFVSYSREDVEIREKVVNVLKKMHVDPQWDANLPVGPPFTEEIKALIERSHVFLPILTETSSAGPWVHQESGYAMGWGIPILIVAIGVDPDQMLHGQQAAKVQRDLSDLAKRLKREDIERLVNDAGEGSGRARFECADDPQTRAEKLAKYTNLALRLGKPGRLRQCAALSSFSIPDKHYLDPIWLRRDGDRPRDEHHWRRAWEERKSLERYARAGGCDLFIDPTVPLKAQGPDARKTRLVTLLEFLDSMPDDKIRVAIGGQARAQNVTIVGDWFFAKAVSPRPGFGYRQTMFTWYAPRVLHEIEKLDQLFDQYYEDYSKGCEPGNPRGRGPSGRSRRSSRE